MKYLKTFTESIGDDDVISHFAFLSDIGFHIFKPYAGRYVVHKMLDSSKIVNFKIGEIKDDISPIFRLFNVEKIILSSYTSDDDIYSVDDFNSLDNDMEYNRLFFDVG